MPLHRGEHRRSGAGFGAGRNDRSAKGRRRLDPGRYGAGSGRHRRGADVRRGAGPPPGGGPDPRRVRLTALLGLVACAVVLPFALASAGPAGENPPPVRQSSVTAGGGADAKPRGSGLPSTPPLGLGAATAMRCGPVLSAPGGIEAQTCVLVQEDETWARTYHRNRTGEPLRAELSLMGPGGRTVRTHCAVGAGEAQGTCETPRGRTRGEPAQYSAVAEFAAAGEKTAAGPLLLRAGSNSPEEAVS